MFSIDDYFADIPLLHFWGTPPVWNDGGFDKRHFSKLAEFIDAQCPSNPRIIETGAGNSTIFFLLHSPAKLVSIDPHRKIYERISKYCTERGVDISNLEIKNDTSARELPPIAAMEPQSFDFALIDGDHGWPVVMVDFCYMLTLVRPGGYIMIDDINVHAIKELVRLLEKQPGFMMRLDLGKSRVYRKDFDGVSLPGWNFQPYIVEKTKADEVSERQYALD